MPSDTPLVDGYVETLGRVLKAAGIDSDIRQIIETIPMDHISAEAFVDLQRLDQATLDMVLDLSFKLLITSVRSMLEWIVKNDVELPQLPLLMGIVAGSNPLLTLAMIIDLYRREHWKEGEL